MNDVSLTAFLTWLITGPGVSAALAVIAELPYIKRYLDRLSYDAKRTLFLAISMAVPLLATWGLVLLGVERSTPELWFRAVAAGWLGFMTSQIAHMLVRTPDPRTHSL